MGKTFSTGLLTNGIWQDSSNNIGIGAAANASFKFQVTGATNLTGALTGTSADFSGNNHLLASNNTLRFTDTDTATEANQQIGKIEFYSSDTSTPGAGVKAYIGAFAQDTTPDAYLSFATQDGSATPNPVERLRISSEGLATFSSSVSATQFISKSASGAAALFLKDASAVDKWEIGHLSNSLYFYNYTRGGTDLTLNGSTGAATFSSSVTAVNSVSITGSYPSISLNATSGTNFYIESTFTSNRLGFGVVGNAPIMAITSGGNVGIGTSSPSYKLSIEGATTNLLYLYSTNNFGELTITAPSTNLIRINGGTGDDIAINTSGTERMRITSAGAVTINTPSSAVEALTVNGYGNSWGAAINGSTTSGQSYGLVVQGGTTGVDTSFLVRSQTGGVNYFRVRGDGLVITPQTYGNSVSTPRTVYIQSDGQIGGISSVHASKTNIQSFDTNWLYELNPVQFNYRKKDENEQYTEEYDNELFYGLIAEETELVNKEICTYNEDKLIGIEYSKLVPVLVKAIQEQQIQIEELKAKIK